MTNWEQVRQQYAVTRDKTYLMNAAVSGMNKKVYETVCKWNETIYEKAAAEDVIYYNLLLDTRKTVSDFLNTEDSEIAFTPNTSHNMNILAMLMKEKTYTRKIVACADEFPSSVLPWHYHGFKLDLVPSKNNIVHPEELLTRVDNETSAVVVSGVQFLSGYKIDLMKLGKELKKKNIPMIVNATQMIGAFKIPLKEAGVSAMSASCHKWLGAGIGQSILYINNEFKGNTRWPIAGWTSVEEPMLLSNDSPPFRDDVSALQTGSMPFTNIAAIGEAINIIKGIGQEEISKRIVYLSDLLEKSLRDIGATINSPRDKDEYKTGTINFTLKNDVPIDTVLEGLKSKGVYINGRRGTLRASIHFYNNEEDVSNLVSALRSLFPA